MPLLSAQSVIILLVTEPCWLCSNKDLKHPEPFTGGLICGQNCRSPGPGRWLRGQRPLLLRLVIWFPSWYPPSGKNELTPDIVLWHPCVMTCTCFVTTCHTHTCTNKCNFTSCGNPLLSNRILTLLRPRQPLHTNVLGIPCPTSFLPSLSNTKTCYSWSRHI